MDKTSAYMEKIDANLAQYNAKLALMKARVAEVHADMKIEYISQLDALETKRDDFLVKYEKLKATNGQAWLDIKTGTEKAWNEMEGSIEKAVSRFK